MGAGHICFWFLHKKNSSVTPDGTFFKLGDQDSNLNKQNQNLLCYRYTIPQDGA